MAYGVMSTPALVIDGEVVLSGKVPSQAEVGSLITTALAANGVTAAHNMTTRAALGRARGAHSPLWPHWRRLAGCGEEAGSSARPPLPAHSTGKSGAQVTFLELGSNSCIPCREMRPVMEGIEQTFGDQVEVVFYDVWDDPAPANEYGVQMIPTQIFLDKDGNEFHRHTGFYPQGSIEALLVERGLTKLTTP